MGNDPPICLGKFSRPGKLAFAVNRQDPDTANIPAQIFGLGLDGVYAAGGLCFHLSKGERIYKTQIHGPGLSALKRGTRPLSIPRGNTETLLFAGHLGVHLLCAEVLLQCGYIEEARAGGAQALPQVFLIVISEGLPID